MPRTRSLAWSELKIGVLTIIAVAITVVTIFLLTERGEMMMVTLTRQPVVALVLLVLLVLLLMWW